MRSKAWLAGAFALLCASAANADDDNALAAQSFERGVDLYRKKQYREAADAFERALKLAPAGPAAYNAARAWKAAGDPAHAADDFATALELNQLTDQQKRDATSELKALEATLGVLDLEGPAGARARVGSAEARSVPAHVHVTAGRLMTVLFTLEAAKDEQTAAVGKGEHVALRMRYTPPPPPPPVAAAPAPPPPAAAPPAESSKPVSLRTPLAVGAMVIGGLFLVGAVKEGLDGMDARDRFVAGGSKSTSLHDDATSKRVLANVFGAIGLVTIGIGVYFVAVTPKESKTTARIGIGPGGLVLDGAMP
jgi:tetratricopeptide (TPR) repeat protein